MMTRLNILIVHNYYQIPGGEDTVVASEKRMLENGGNKVILYSRNNSELKDMNKFQTLFLPFSVIYSRKTSLEIKRIIREEEIDIVHVHNTLSLISASVYYAALSMKVPVVQTIHNFRLLCPGATFYRDGHVCEDCVSKGLLCAVKHSCYRKSKLQTLACVISCVIHRAKGVYGKINYICLTDFNKQKLFSIKQIREKNVYVKPNFVNSIREFIPGIKREKRFIFAGRLDSLKGIDLLLEAWKLMGKDAPKLVICGIGPMEEWCKNYIKTHGVNAEMLGFIPNTEVRKMIANSKAVVLPTKWYEGFPMSIVEAYSVGTPVVCSDLGNAGSIVIDGITGFKFDNSSPEDLAKCIYKVNDDVCETTLNFYMENYTEEKNYRQLIGIYKNIITELS
jgi:glycosyltransferase involved in cell wall biosynthesis